MLTRKKEENLEKANQYQGNCNVLNGHLLNFHYTHLFRFIFDFIKLDKKKRKNKEKECDYRSHFSPKSHICELIREFSISNFLCADFVW